MDIARITRIYRRFSPKVVSLKAAEKWKTAFVRQSFSNSCRSNSMMIVGVQGDRVGLNLLARTNRWIADFLFIAIRTQTNSFSTSYFKIFQISILPKIRKLQTHSKYKSKYNEPSSSIIFTLLALLPLEKSISPNDRTKYHRVQTVKR